MLVLSENWRLISPDFTISLFEADRIFRMILLGHRILAQRCRADAGRIDLKMFGVGRSHGQLRLFQHILERLDIARLEARRIRIGHISGDRRLPHREPFGLT